jgi:diacylglycerol kinase (ATP)
LRTVRRLRRDAAPEAVIAEYICAVRVEQARPSLEPKQMLIIFNPTAGRRHRKTTEAVLDVLASAGARVELAETQHAGHATDLAREAAVRGINLVVAAGGDGTIAEVVNGLAGSDSSLGIIPSGTANVLAHELALPFDPALIAALLTRGHARPIWPGLIEWTADRRLFVQMAGAGFDAEVVHRTKPWLKKALGGGAYMLQGLREAPRYPFPAIRVRLDGVETSTRSVVVCKGRYYGGRYTLAPSASPLKRGFTVALFDRGGPLAALTAGVAMPFNRLSCVAGLRLARAAHVEIAGEHIAAQVDGDAAGTAPISIQDASAPIRVVMPSASQPNSSEWRCRQERDSPYP